MVLVRGHRRKSYANSPGNIRCSHVIEPNKLSEALQKGIDFLELII